MVGKSATLGYSPQQCHPKLLQLPLNQVVDHAEAYGRIAFSIPDIHTTYERVKSSGDTIQNHPVKLDTPGKATVEVVILCDRDGFEICFVGREGFNALSTTKEGDDYIDYEG